MLKSIPIISHFFKFWRALNQPAPLNEFKDYDEYWEKRQAGSGQAATGQVLHRYVTIADRLQPNTRLLDIGCGEGAFLKYVRSRWPQSQVVGADISAQAIAHVRDAGLEGIVMDVSQPLREQIQGKFDDVVLMEVIEHVPDAEELVRQVIALQPQRIFITIPNIGYIMHRLRLFFGGRFPITMVLCHMKEHLRFWTEKDFRQWAEVMQLEVVQVTGQERDYHDALTKFLIRLNPGFFAAQLVYELRPVKTS
jgi:methionine biosynthesis protein MetW